MRGKATLEIENHFLREDTMGDLSKQKCVPCAVGGVPLKGQSLSDFARQLDPAWKVVNEHHIEREYTFKNFRQALDFTNEIGKIAEEQGHHPDILLSWGKVKVTFWTHKINGLTESDFIMAAKCDTCYHPKKAA